MTREPGCDDEPLPYDSAWWADFNRHCNALTQADIDSIITTAEKLSEPKRKSAEAPIGKLEAAFLGIVDDEGTSRSGA